MCFADDSASAPNESGLVFTQPLRGRDGAFHADRGFARSKGQARKRIGHCGNQPWSGLGALDGRYDEVIGHNHACVTFFHATSEGRAMQRAALASRECRRQRTDVAAVAQQRERRRQIGFKADRSRFQSGSGLEWSRQRCVHCDGGRHVDEPDLDRHCLERDVSGLDGQHHRSGLANNGAACLGTQAMEVALPSTIVPSVNAA